VDEANFASAQYAHQPSWRPGLALFQQLVRRVLPKAHEVDGSPSGIASGELAGFPIQIAPILLRVPLLQGGSRLGVALLYCQERNQAEHSVESTGGSASFVLTCRVYSSASSWRQHRDALVEMVSTSSAEVRAVKKRAQDLESRHNELQLLRSRHEVEQAVDELWVDHEEADALTLDLQGDLLAIQKYVPFKGAASTSTAASSTETQPGRKAWIARCASRKRDKNSSKVWIISGGDSEQALAAAVTDSSRTDCQIVRCSIDQAWSEPRLLASTCVLSLEKALHVRLDELVVDLLQDPCGTWWLLQVKAFALASIRPASAATVASSSASSLLSKRTPRGLSRTQSAPTRFEAGTPQWKKWRCAGRYCGGNSNPTRTASQQVDAYATDGDGDKEPCGFLTKKMLRSCEFYDAFVQQQDVSLAGGFTEFSSALAFHLQHRLPKRDRSQLYEPQPLCTACLRQYHSLRKQWLETVVPPKSSSAPGHLRRTTSSKTHHEAGTHGRLPPLHLPSLPRGSDGPPLLPDPGLTAQAKLLNGQQDTAREAKQPSYLDELAAMERMLAEHEPPSTLRKTTSASQSPNHVETTSAAPLEPEDVFPRWDGLTRIEAMWQDLRLKPLERQLAGPSLQLHESGGYNSISLQQELAKEADPTSKHPSPQRTPEAAQRRVPRTRHEAYPVHVRHCRRVFEDEAYREELVNCAIRALSSGKANVSFVVTPRSRTPTGAPSNKQSSREDEDELTEVALRSLYIDAKQAIAASSDSLASGLSLSSWPMRPKVWREASGCFTVRLGAA
jgi:hypothetical protein